MPYDLTLQAFALPEWFAEPPREWEQRLREISPKHEKLQHLRFRYRAPQADWNHPERGVWELYACTPRALVTAERASQFEKHWSELPIWEQVGRKAFVSNYQHFLWHTQGVEAKRFWVLQGPWGGTPAVYSERERRYLDASSCVSEPYPLGFFPACPFNERAVTLILQRDRLVKANMRLDEMDKQDRPAALKAEDDEAERVFRETYLDTMYVMMQPQVEFMQSQIAREAMADLDLPTMSKAQEDSLSTWKDHYLEHGTVPGAGRTTNRALQLAVK